jgi:hypothetical protein
MGLDITAYSNVVKAENPDYDEYEGFEFIVYDNGFNQYSPLEKDIGYDAEDEFGFRAGSYSGYGVWRNWLCQLVHGVTSEELWENIDDYKGKAFVELINFSDCEGTLGTDVCKKLLKDFSDNQDLMSELDNDDEAMSYFISSYYKWKEAFVYGADDGCVQFH